LVFDEPRPQIGANLKYLQFKNCRQHLGRKLECLNANQGSEDNVSPEKAVFVKVFFGALKVPKNLNPNNIIILFVLGGRMFQCSSANNSEPLFSKTRL
jgi:hypothetical protein